ncbi:MAG: N-acetylglucosamine-6-phosphate deacetylase [Corynebacterium sp.]|nr:N-acetylglucosamine-6-phosphate deacetylase [Corynebacterium sp.]
MLYVNGTIYDGSGAPPIYPGALLTQDDRILYAGPMAGLPATDQEPIDLQGGIIVPGYIDIHHHGGAGGAYDDGLEAAKEAVKVHRQHGTTRCVISLVTASMPTLIARMSALRPLVDEDPLVLGLHAEGPFLHPSKKGAHDPELLTAPLDEHLEKLLDAHGDALVQITIAPELENGIKAVATLTSHKVKVAVGHTDADYEKANEAFTHGATILTHTFNAMNGIGHRAPGPVIAALRTPTVWLEIINDGIHVHPSVVKTLFLEAPERTVLVTDSMSATCSPDGHYQIGNLDVTVDKGIATLTHGGSLAGSTLTMDKAVANAVTKVGVPLELAVAAATSHPAKAIGKGDLYGLLKEGYPADYLLLDQDTLLPHTVYANGQEIKTD